MRIRTIATAAIVVAATTGAASAAPNVASVTQKGSLLVWPAIAASPDESSLVRIQNDGTQDIDIKCYWMDVNKNRVDFIIPVTKNQAVWFDAATGQGTYQVNPFPNTVANGMDNPFAEPATVPGPGPVQALPFGMLACWAVDPGSQQQVKWNHLSGTATYYQPVGGIAAEYSAYAFFVPAGIDLQPVGAAGVLNLNGVEYDSCPLYQIGQFSPTGATTEGAPVIASPTLLSVGCTLDFRQDWIPVFTKLQFDIWNEDEVKFTGAYECADSVHVSRFGDIDVQTPLGGGLTADLIGIDAGAQNFLADTLGTYAARYRIQAVKSTQCEKPATTGAGDTYRPAITTQAVGILGVQFSLVIADPQIGVPFAASTTLASAGKFTGKVQWDPSGAVPEGGIR